MESISKDINYTFFEKYHSKEKENNENSQNFIKLGINNYIHNNKNKNNRIYEKKDKNNMTTINETKNRQKQLKKYLCNINNQDDLKTLNNEKKNKDMNITEISSNNAIKNIKVNKIKIDDNKKDKNNTSFTKKKFYHKPLERNKSFHFYGSQNKYQEKIDNNHLFYYLNNNKKNQRKSNLISVRSFDKNKDFVNDQFLYSEYFNLINPLNKDVSNFSFYQYNILNNNMNNYNKNNSNTNYTYNNLTTPGKNKLKNNTSQLLLGFKNIKTFCAHLEILISLYLKRNFNYFKEKIKEYINNKKVVNKTLHENINNKNGPIINVNNAHCSLYCSININPDNNNNNNKLFNTVFNSNKTPITKINEAEKENIKLDKNLINNINKNKLFFLNNEYDINTNNNKKIIKDINKSIYIPKNKIRKFNNNIVNENKIKGIDKDNEENREIYNYNDIDIKNINKDLKQSSPIKEMNINLKKINVCKLNELNQLYLSQNLYQNKANNISISDMNNILNINNNNTLHAKFNSNIIELNKQDSSNISRDKNYKLKKISSAKNGVYTKPKEKNKKKIIKEIKIQNNQLTPFKHDISYNNKNNHNNNKNKNIRIENIITVSNSFIKNKNEDLINIRINNSKEKNLIKKIYIRRKSKNENKTDNNNNNNSNNNNDSKGDSNERKCLSTLLSFKKNETKKIFTQNEILIKHIQTSDERLYINIKYIILNNKLKSKNKNYDINNLKIENKNTISIINNKILISESLKNSIQFKISDIFSFDNDKKGKKEIKNKKSINNNLIKFINKMKKIVVKNIRKLIIIRCKRNILLKKIIEKNNKKILRKYFKKLFKNNKKIKNEKNVCGVYHKINYNDDFNLTKRMKSPNINKNNNNLQSKNKDYNLSLQNTIQQNKVKKNKNKKRELSSSINFNNTLKFKEINIFVHNNTKV